MIILGLMSGTSLDGVDLAICDVDSNTSSILAAKTVAYSSDWHRRLSTLEHASALDLVKAHVELGHFFGRISRDFIVEQGLPVEAVASHGHTIFHQPRIRLTTQIGDGDAIAAETRLPVVSNFRTLDVALGGQGAPLVPIGDALLFGQYDACLNLGGIANISFSPKSSPAVPFASHISRIAFDICPCNMAFNRLAARLGFDYDPEGMHARAGKAVGALLARLDDLAYYRLAPPKSLGKEWFVSDFWPLVEACDASVDDLLATVSRHVAGRIAKVLRDEHISTLLVTGGGAYNRCLLDTLSSLVPDVKITIPDSLIVNYKEALVFAFLGYLRLAHKVNTLASVTGAGCDSVGGTVSGLFV